jgi:hypothetical protein
MSFPKAGKDHDLTSYEALGLDLQGKPVFRPEGRAVALAEVPPGKGKTVNVVIGSILRRVLLKNTPPPASSKGSRT